MFSAIYQSRSQAHVENRNKIISKTFSNAVARGDINSDLDAELYVAEAEIKENQLIFTDGSTTFKTCSGQAPRTANASLSAPSMEVDEIEGCIERMNAINGKVVGAIYKHCNAVMPSWDTKLCSLTNVPATTVLTC